jgi:hypothetical protein
VSEGVRYHAALALLLQIVITDGVSGIQRLLQISFLKPVMTLLGVVGPDTSKTVRLQFLPDQQAIVALHLGSALTCGLHLLRHAEQGLDMVADLMGNHIGLGEIAGDRKARGHFIEELQIEIHLPVARAIERTDRRIGEAAGRADATAKEHQRRVAILLAGLLEQRAPSIFGIAQNRLNEGDLRIVAARWCIAL